MARACEGCGGWPLCYANCPSEGAKWAGAGAIMAKDCAKGPTCAEKHAPETGPLYWKHDPCEECDQHGVRLNHLPGCSLDSGPTSAPVVDMVNEPPHYRGVIVTGNVHMRFPDLSSPVLERRTVAIEAVDVIEALGLGYLLGTVLKYLWRAGKKGDRIEDLKKARWFLDREIAKAGK